MSKKLTREFPLGALNWHQKREWTKSVVAEFQGPTGYLVPLAFSATQEGPSVTRWETSTMERADYV